MASPQPNNFNFPFFPSPPFRPFHPPPPPSHPFSPPPPPPPRRAPPPPSPRVPPPPPPRVPHPPPPHVRPPPPPSHPIAPPPPYVRPPPPPAPVPPSPAPHHHTLIVIVFVSLGGLLFLSLLAFALFCFIKRRKKKASQEMGMVHFDEHNKMVKEEIVSGPFGQKVVVMTVEDDVHIDAEVKEKEKFGDGLHAESSSTSANDQINSSGHDQDVGNASSGIEHHHHHELQQKPTSQD